MLCKCGYVYRDTQKTLNLKDCKRDKQTRFLTMGAGFETHGIGFLMPCFKTGEISCLKFPALKAYYTGLVNKGHDLSSV